MLISLHCCPAGTHRASGKRVAVKSMRVAAKGTVVHSNDSTWSDVAAEVAVLCRLEHPNVITLDEFFFTETEVHLVTPLVQGAPCAAFQRIKIHS